MALPRVNTPDYTLELPSTGETIKYRPFLVKEQKILMMAQDTKDETQLADAMGTLVSSCTYGTLDASTSPLFDIEYVFLKIRSKSVGSKVDLMVVCPDDEKTQAKVSLDLDDINVTMTDDHINEVQVNDKVKVIFRYPILHDLKGLTENPTDVDRVFHVLNRCISQIHFGDDVYQRSDMTEKDIDEFVDQLTTEQFERLSDFFNSMPKLRHAVKVTNPKTKVKSEVVLEGLESFLG
tara:strand:- start:1124 stop:1831 length:708 start_codon:yes stop_codon:yes gene_type:complete